MRRLYFIVLVFLYPSTILFSQQSFTVSGYIIDSFNGDTLIDGEVYNAKTLKTSKIDSIEKKAQNVIKTCQASRQNLKDEF